MPDFADMLQKSLGEPVLYEGKLIQAYDRIPVANGQRLLVTFEATRSEWRQGIRLNVERGQLKAGNDDTFATKFILWQDTCVRPLEFAIKAKSGAVFVYNAWDFGNGVVEAWQNGAAMIVEQIPNGRRYRCNDWTPDDDFDDLIFTIHVFPASSRKAL